MPSLKRPVLITGCSDGGMGAALAVAFHKAGLQVYATARTPTKMSHLESIGIKTLTLDVQSESSIAACVSKLPALDILVNNAGNGLSMPIADVSVLEAKTLFDLNVWSHLSVTQAFLPLLIKSSNGMIVNQTSIAAVTIVPWQGVYCASKAALAMLSDALRLELHPFGVKVIDLRTGVVNTNFIKNMVESVKPSVPEGSIYEPVKEVVEKNLRLGVHEGGSMPAEQWAESVVHDLLKKKPPAFIWKGDSAFLARAWNDLAIWNIGFNSQEYDRIRRC